jgi:ribonuclease P protein component
MTARFRRTGRDDTRFGMSTGRSLGGAVVRNRVRRRLRVALQALLPALEPGWDILVIARPALATTNLATLAEVLERLLSKGGILGGSDIP